MSSAREAPQSLNPAKLPATPWDLRLREEMISKGLAAFEEALLPELLRDLRRGLPAGIGSPDPSSGLEPP
jgi:hypothetical protein